MIGVAALVDFPCERRRRARSEHTAAVILAEVRDAALEQLSRRRHFIEKAMVTAPPRELAQLTRRRDLVELAIAAASRI